MDTSIKFIEYFFVFLRGIVMDLIRNRGKWLYLKYSYFRAVR